MEECEHYCGIESSSACNSMEEIEPHSHRKNVNSMHTFVNGRCERCLGQDVVPPFPQMLDWVRIWKLSGPWRMDNFDVVLLKPLGDDSCFVGGNVVKLQRALICGKEML